jgi:GrpB-like predicted nucleotidyltransferase (UPF0157 family)
MVDRIEIVPHRPEWHVEYTDVETELRRALGGTALDVQHIGSTAVIGLAAKDVIDVQVSVDALDAATCRPPLEEIGFVWRSDITHDHRPPNLGVSPGDLEKLYARRVEPRRVNCHIRVPGRFNHRYPLLFRDYLSSDASARDAYGRVKGQLARHLPFDIDAYYEVKDPVMDIIWRAAERWASETGWNEPFGGE